MARNMKYQVKDGKCENAINCGWCKTVKDRLTNEPLAEPLQTQLKQEIESHGICQPCADAVKQEYRDSKRRFLVEAMLDEIQA